jgi:hypothetical protein
MSLVDRDDTFASLTIPEIHDHLQSSKVSVDKVNIYYDKAMSNNHVLLTNLTFSPLILEFFLIITVNEVEGSAARRRHSCCNKNGSLRPLYGASRNGGCEEAGQTRPTLHSL